MPNVFRRQREEEWMDLPEVDAVELARSLKFIRRINSLLGYTRATISHLARFSRRWKPREEIRIVDFATGSADVPIAIANWAAKNRFNVHITGIDLHPMTVRAAQEATAGSKSISIIHADAMRSPFEDRSFDYAISSMFLHHLSDEQAVQVLREMNRVASRGLIVADILRGRRALAWITLLTVLANPMVRHDARVSVKQAFTADEILELTDRAQLHFTQVYRHFGHRFVLAGER